jgi:MOSC domain-containing protein YiiM
VPAGRYNTSVRASVLQINISGGGVPKLPVPESLVTRLGIEGDLHAHPEVHGGPSKALLLIASEGTRELIESGFPLFDGALGENLTTLGLDRRAMRIGQRYRIGEVMIELTTVRTPCRTIQKYGAGIGKAIYDGRVQEGDYGSERWGLSGFYARVIRGGTIRTGDAIDVVGDMDLLGESAGACGGS